MISGQINWDQFRIKNNDARGVRYKFEDLCRQLFVNEFLSKNTVHKYLHSNPNNPGIESEPILDEEHNKYIGYQAKFFDEKTDYRKIEESVKKAIEHYKGNLECIYLFCNTSLTTTSASYKKIEALLSEAGISLVPITDNGILDLVRKYPLLSMYYFGNHNITIDWFLKIANISADILGERYNPVFNVDTDISKNLSVFLQDKTAVEYFNEKKRNLTEKLTSLKWKLTEYKDYLFKLGDFIAAIPDIDYDSVHDVEKWNDIVRDKFSNEIKFLENKRLSVETSLEKVYNSNREKASDYRVELDKLTILLDLYNKLELSPLEIRVLNSRVLVVRGKAGIGKTQLFANKTFSFLNDNEEALLILGGDCSSEDNILSQIQTNLRINFNFEDLIDILECIGTSKRRVIPIFIDALNESWKPRLWKTVLRRIYDKISETKYVRLAISFRDEYESEILPDKFTELPGIEMLEHLGFVGDSFEATRKFLDYYGLPFSPMHMFNRSMENPLFLTLYCKTYQGDDVPLPELYNRLLQKANCNIYDRMDALRNAGFAPSDNVIIDIVDAISKYMLETGKRRLEKNEVASLSIWQLSDIPPRPFIQQLIHEGILHGYTYNGKDYICFTYDQMNDYYPAKALAAMCLEENEFRSYLSENVLGIVDGEIKNWGNRSLFVSACALFAEKFHKECIDIIDSIKDEHAKDSIFEMYLESFEWRNEIYISIKGILDYCNKLRTQPDVVWNVFIINSVKKNHLLNADSLYALLIIYPLNKRDYLWTRYINGLTSYDERVIQIVELYSRCESLQITDKEQIRLLLILLSWFLTSSNRWLRDTTSKAMIEILKNNFEFSEYLLRLFEVVNDPYVLQRLYGVILGTCTKRVQENKAEYLSLVKYVYENIFNKDIVYQDILLRDYARLIIENFVYEYPDDYLKIELDKIKPPYKSLPIPDIEDQKYCEQELNGSISILRNSMRFEGNGFYGDFGRYVFQSAIKNFKIDNYKVFNYAMWFILNELEYKAELFDAYDKHIGRYSFDRHLSLKIERIGKKYQWIAMYNILARISDTCQMIDCYSTKDEIVAYTGPSELYVKDFDPTLNANNLFSHDAPDFLIVKEHIKTAVEENRIFKDRPDFDEIAWLHSKSVFFEQQITDLMLTGSDGNQWIVLSKYANTGRDNLANDRLLIWNCLYGYFVSDDQLVTLKEYSSKRENFLTYDITNIPETYVIYNREYPWSSGSQAINKYQYRNLRLRIGETITETIEEPVLLFYEKFLEMCSNAGEESDNDNYFDEEHDIKNVKKTYTRQCPVTIDVGNILSATQDLLWEEEFDASKEEAITISHPCAELIKQLKLRQKVYDGYYYNADGELIAFDTDLTKQKAGLVIKKSAIDSFLSMNKLNLIWFIKAEKEVHDESGALAKFKDFTGLLVYTGDNIEGEYYIPIEPRNE